MPYPPQGLPAAVGDSLFVTYTDNLRASNDVEKYTNSTSYVKMLETKLDTKPPAKMRIKFDLKRGAGGTAYGQLYLNGVAVGTEQSTTSNNYVTESQDFDTSGWQSGDLIQLYVKISSASYYAWETNLRFYYDIYLPATNQNPA